jgi:hypothetical protein
MKKLLQKHKKHIYEYGLDMEEVANWKWTAWNNNMRSSWFMKTPMVYPAYDLPFCWLWYTYQVLWSLAWSFLKSRCNYSMHWYKLYPTFETQQICS